MDKILHLTAHLKCSPADAFALFTNNAKLESWLTAAADVEPSVGGKFELFWAPDDRENDSTIGCRVTAVAENELIAFEWRSPRQFKHFANSADPLTHCVITFHRSDDGTTVHLVHSGWRGNDEWEEARIWQERAWGYAFSLLAEKFGG